jgi:hypothetical protein
LIASLCPSRFLAISIAKNCSLGTTSQLSRRKVATEEDQKPIANKAKAKEKAKTFQEEAGKEKQKEEKARYTFKYVLNSVVT